MVDRGDLNQISLAIGEMRARLETNCKKLEEVKNLIVAHMADEEGRLRAIEDRITEAKVIAKMGGWIATFGSGTIGGGFVILARKIGII